VNRGLVGLGTGHGYQLRSREVFVRPPAGPLARQAVDGLLPCQRDPQLRFSDRPDELELAKAHCRPCPLRGPCLAGAVERREPYGVWGGEYRERAPSHVKRTGGCPRGPGWPNRLP
jgi:WhiB family transcriptional regulator, redox-sensing transcriptional regulator